MHLPDMRAEMVRGQRESQERAARAGEADAQMVREWRAATLRLSVAELYWVSAEMQHVALDASVDIPEWTPATVIPDPVGLIVYEEPLPNAAVKGADRSLWVTGPAGLPRPPQVPVAGFSWIQAGGMVTVTVLVRTEHLRAIEPAFAPGALWPIGDIRPLPATAPLGSDHPTHGEAAGMIALLGATWTLMGQPTMASPRQITPNGRAARDARRASKPAPPVSIVDLRRMQTVRDDYPSDSGRTYNHRWVVRGHWRQQAYGPGRSMRRPTWVPSYIKGPEGAPLLKTEHVNVWRR